MKPNRRLALRRESLTELTADELALAGGTDATRTLRDCPIADVLERLSLAPRCSWSCPA